MGCGADRQARQKAPLAAALCLLLALGGCGFGYRTAPAPMEPPGTPFEEGVASWYGPGFHGKNTSSGEIYDQNDLTAAHRTLPIGTRVLVTNLNNGRSTEVRINDRGPFVDERIIDLSYAAARTLDLVGPGTAPVRVELLQTTPGRNMPTAAYVVQVGSFTDRDRARRLEARLRYEFTSIHIEPAATARQTYFRVRIGPFAEREQAVRMAQRISQLGLTSLVMEQ